MRRLALLIILVPVFICDLAGFSLILLRDPLADSTYLYEQSVLRAVQSRENPAGGTAEIKALNEAKAYLLAALQSDPLNEFYWARLSRLAAMIETRQSGDDQKAHKIAGKDLRLSAEAARIEGILRGQSRFLPVAVDSAQDGASIPAKAAP